MNGASHNARGTRALPFENEAVAPHGEESVNPTAVSARRLVSGALNRLRRIQDLYEALGRLSDRLSLTRDLPRFAYTQGCALVQCTPFALDRREAPSLTTPRSLKSREHPTNHSSVAYRDQAMRRKRLTGVSHNLPGSALHVRQNTTIQFALQPDVSRTSNKCHVQTENRQREQDPQTS